MSDKTIGETLHEERIKKALKCAEELAAKGVLFVPMPARNSADYLGLCAMYHARTGDIKNENS